MIHLGHRSLHLCLPLRVLGVELLLPRDPALSFGLVRLFLRVQSAEQLLRGLRPFEPRPRGEGSVSWRSETDEP